MIISSEYPSNVSIYAGDIEFVKMQDFACTDPQPCNTSTGCGTGTFPCHTC